jgi:hypothetical protein
MLPVAILGVAGAYFLIERERDTFERGVRDRARALTTAIGDDIGLARPRCRRAAFPRRSRQTRSAALRRP